MSAHSRRGASADRGASSQGNQEDGESSQQPPLTPRRPHAWGTPPRRSVSRLSMASGFLESGAGQDDDDGDDGDSGSGSDGEYIGVGDPAGPGNVAPQFRPAVLHEMPCHAPKVRVGGGCRNSIVWDVGCGSLLLLKMPFFLSPLLARVCAVACSQDTPDAVATLIQAGTGLHNANMTVKALAVLHEAERKWLLYVWTPWRGLQLYVLSARVQRILLAVCEYLLCNLRLSLKTPQYCGRCGASHSGGDTYTPSSTS